MQLIVVLNTIEPLTPLLPDFVVHNIIRCRRMWQFSPTVKEWIDTHPERKEDIEQVYSQLTEDEQVLYRSFELEVSDIIDVKILVNCLNALDTVLFTEVN